MGLVITDDEGQGPGEEGRDQDGMWPLGPSQGLGVGGGEKSMRRPGARCRCALNGV